MISNACLAGLRASAVLFIAAALIACGGGESNGNSAPNSVAGGPQAQAASQDSLAVERDNAAENAAKRAYEAKNGKLPGTAATSKDYHPTRVLAKLVNAPQAKDASARSNAFSSLGLRQITGFASGQSVAKQASQKSSSNGMAVFEITNPALTVPQAIEQLQRSGLVVYAEPDYWMKTRLAPNDPSYGIYWHLKNTGQTGTNGFSGTAGNDINAEVAWNTTTGNGQVVVAVVDSGVKFDHPDLAPNMWSSAGTPRVVVPGDTSGAAGVVDDANGANLAIERTAADTSIMPYNTDASDHGTMVSGFVGAAGNNAIGGAGVSWNVKIMGVKIEGPDLANAGGASTSSIVNGVRYALAKKAAGVNLRVINISYGSFFPSQAFKDALDEANAAGVLVVVAAGNDGSNDERTVGFPSGYKTPTLISVGALSRNNTRASFSNYGPLVHLFAPGDNVPTTSSRVASTTPGYIAANYRYINGTSFASPIVAGAAALLWMQYPNETALQIKARLLNSTTGFLTTADSLTGGKLNLGAAIAPQVPCTGTAPVINELAAQLVQGATHKISAYVKTCPSTGSVNVLVDSTSTQIKDDGVYPDEYANDGYYSGTFVAPASAISTAGVSVIVQDTVAGPLSSGIVTKLLKRATSYAQSSATYAWDAPIFSASYVGLIGNFDDGALPVTSPFPINFDGKSTSSFYMSTNGYVCMDDINCVSAFVYPLPSGKEGKPLGTTQAMLAPWWHDWYVDCTQSDMHREVAGTAPNRRFVLTWKNIFPFYQGINCATATNGVSFQMVFYENQNYIDFRYQDTLTSVPVGAVNPSAGLRGSGGIQLSGGKLGTQMFYNSATVAANTAFRFTPSSPSFSDVDASDFFAISIEGLRGARITTGCSATQFCAEFSDASKTIGRQGITVDRIKTKQQEMAAFIARAINGHDALVDYTPFPASGFTDVFSTFTRYVNFVKAKGIMTGTGTAPDKFCSPNCDNDFVTRAQMARYLVKAVRGESYVPPAATGVFNDVPASHPEAPFIEEVARMKITLGIGGGAYGPNDTVTRGQMATFLQRTFRPFDPH
jgi:subtilisin family serine protease